MNKVTHVNGQLYYEGQPVTNDIDWSIAEKEYRKKHYQCEDLKAQIETLRAEIVTLED